MGSTPPAKGKARIGRLGNYEVLAHIATGGMGAVYKARDLRNNREVALKVLSMDMVKRPHMLERFKREAEHALQLHHDNIVELYESGETQGIPFLAMEFVDGVDLHEYITRKGKLDPREARAIVLQTTCALHHAFKQGIVHRDIKPSNLLVTRKAGRLHVKLTDLGLSRQVDHDAESRLTREGTTVGTVDYMSPEQGRDSNSADTRSDIYSLGCTLYHMLTGRAPFHQGSMIERLFKHVEEEAPFVRDLNPQVPLALATVLHRMLAKDPADRYQTPRDLMEALVSGEVEAPNTLDALQGLAEEERDVDRRAKKSVVTLATPPPRPSLRRPTPLPDRPAEDTEEAPSLRPARKRSARKRPPWLLPVGVAAALAILSGIVALSMDSSGSSKRPDRTTEQRAETPPPVTPADPPNVKKPPGDTTTTAPPDKPPGPVVWPPLRPDAPQINKEQLRHTFEAATANDPPPPPADASTYLVSRTPRGPRHYSSLRQAAAAAASEKAADPLGRRLPAVVIEIHDNGPLYETPAAFADKDVLIRAAPGYRPLIFWEAAANQEGEPFFSARGGRLTLQDLDLVFSRDRPEAARRAFVRVTGGDFFARRCTFSVAGSHPAGVALARLEAAPGERKPHPTHGRLHRCQGRGQSLIALDLDTPQADVLIDECLLVGGELPLVDVKVRGEEPVRLRWLRSTLVAGQTCLAIRADRPRLLAQAVDWHAWDVVLARPGRSQGGVLVSLPEKGTPALLRWQAVNCLVCGWRDPIPGAKTLEVANRIETEGWPAAMFLELAGIAATEYRTDAVPGAPVGFAATSWPCLAGKESVAPPTLGCPVAHLPPARDNWLQWTVDSFVALPVDVQPDARRSEIPMPNDGLYHGERLDISRVDVGAYLERVKAMSKLGPRVVLHLFRSGDGKTVPTSPVRLKGSDLVVVLEPYQRQREVPPPGPPGPPGPPDPSRTLPGSGQFSRPPDTLPKKPAAATAESERLLLFANSRAVKDGQAFVEVEGGNLDVIGGEIRCPDFRQALLTPYLIRVKGGNLRLYDCWLQGPLFDPPDNFKALVRVEGAGPAAGPEAACQCGIGASVLASGRAAVSVAGLGARLRLERSVIVAGTDGVAFEPGTGPHPRMSLHCTMERMTVAARGAVVHLGDVGRQPPPAEPLVLQTRACAFLNPFGRTAGMLLYEGDGLRQGVMVWRSDGDVCDKRLHFVAAAADAVPTTAQAHAVWRVLWGPAGERHAVTNLPLTGRFEKERWPLARLALPWLRGKPIAFDPRDVGADLVKLGVIKSLSRRQKNK